LFLFEKAVYRAELK